MEGQKQHAWAILCDIRSVQRYIFSGSKLSTHIGASHNTANLFRDVMCGVLDEMVQKGRLKKTGTMAEWRDAWTKLQADETYDHFENGDDFIVAQIGGGKIILLFRPELATEDDQSLLKDVIHTFTKTVLCRYPGLKTGAVIHDVILDEDFFKRGGYDHGIEVLFKALHENQDTVYPVVSPPYTGLTLTCPVNGEPATHYDADGMIDPDGAPQFFSQEVYAKAAAAKETNSIIQHRFFQKENIFYEFPMEFEQLGQKEGESYIAVVHIDGNKMGIKFQGCTTWGKYNQTAKSVQESTKQAFRELVKYIADRYEAWQSSGDLFLDGTHLPIRPLILGGDDVAFVCTAKIALEATKFYMEALLHPKDPSMMPIYSCAGIAIIPEKYPFFRGYELAEQLCSEAKKKSRGVPDADGNTPDACWLDFAILHGEQEPELAEIRAQEYGAMRGSLHFGPYLVAQSEDAPAKDNFFHVDHLLECIQKLRKGMEKGREGGIPQGKLKEMRFVLAHDVHAEKAFLEQLDHLRMHLPEVAGWEGFQKSLWQPSPDGKGEVTPYVDAVEMLDFTMNTPDEAETAEEVAADDD